MLTGVAFVPQAPALVPAIGRGLDAELRDVRAACRVAIGRVAPPGTHLEVVGADDALPVGDWLLEDAGVLSSAPAPDATVLLVLGDGSARRTEQAPGYLDARAESYDREIAAALGSGDPSRLAALDAGLGSELLAAGVPAWHETAARLDTSEFTADLLYDGAPFGVGYFVATWLRA